MCHFTLKYVSLAVDKRQFADFIGKAMQFWLKFLTFLLQSAICRASRQQSFVLGSRLRLAGFREKVENNSRLHE